MTLPSSPCATLGIRSHRFLLRLLCFLAAIPSDERQPDDHHRWAAALVGIFSDNSMKLHRIAFVTALLAALASVAAANRPNILFLFADDQRADTIGAWGNPHIQTPHLDRLAAAGFSFRGNYCFGGNSGAVCVPSRAMLLSGKTWFHVNTATLEGTKLLPELFGEHGYVTFGTGKWHNGQASWLRAFQQGQAVMFGGMSDHTKVPIRDLGTDGKLTAERLGQKFSSELFADAAIRFLKRHRGPQPFFLYVAFTAPHDPRMPPLTFREAYYRNRPPLPANFLPQLPFDNGMMAGGRDENLAAWPRTEAVIRNQLAEYYGLITHLDEQIGRLLAALKRSGQAEDTLILYAADNGLALGSHGLLGKQSVFEHSMRVPLIIAGPGIPAGRSTEAFTYLFDLFPTLCDVIGLPRPQIWKEKASAPSGRPGKTAFVIRSSCRSSTSSVLSGTTVGSSSSTRRLATDSCSTCKRIPARTGI